MHIANDVRFVIRVIHELKSWTDAAVIGAP